MSKKRLLVGMVIAAVSFGLGYAGTVYATHAADYGYFKELHQNNPRWNVMDPNSNCGSDANFAIPYWVSDPNTLFAAMECRLQYNTYRDHVGAAFIIGTMVGSKNLDMVVGGSEWNDFKARIEYAQSQGWINWYGSDVCSQPNSFYQPSRVDVAYFWSCATGPSDAIVISFPGGQYILKRYCANPVGSMPALPQAWYAAGRTSVTDSAPDPGDTSSSITTHPGATLTFTHRIKNLGPTTASIWYRDGRGAHSVEGTYNAQYYNNTSLSGAPVFTREEAGIYHNWDSSVDLGAQSLGPDSPIGSTNFSVRWTRTDYFPAGGYTFTTATDDGVRLYIDGVLRINDWNTHGVTQRSAVVNLTEGRHTIVMEYFQGVGGYYAAMWYHYYAPGGIKVSTAFDAQYYNNTSLSGTPVRTRTDPEVNFEWGTGSPGYGINADNFSVRWTRYAYFPAGNYLFATRTDDGVRLYVDDVLIVNDWNGHPPTENQVTRSMTAGIHKIVMEYFEGGGGATAGLSWVSDVGGAAGWGAIAVGAEPSVETVFVPVPANAAPGTRICRSLTWANQKHNGGQPMYSGTADMGGNACATVQGGYNLLPTVTPSAAQAQAGDTVRFEYRVRNDGNQASPSITCTVRDQANNVVTVSGLACARSRPT